MALKLLASNNASSVLAAGISASATALTVNTGTGTLFPTPVSGTSYFKLTLVDAATGTITEVMHVTAVSGDNFTVQRAQEGTTARIWSANDIAANMLTAGTLAALLQINNNLSEITAAGSAAMAAAVANLGLGTGLTGVVGEARNAKMSVTTASATATFTADELIVGVALGGLQYRLGNFSKTINLATTGAGGMDTGTAPVSGFVALYAIYNPTTAASALLAVNATAAVAPTVYGGANMPAGYTASALVSVVPTTSESLIAVVQQTGRKVNVVDSLAFTSSTPTSVGIALNAPAYIPKNAISVDLYVNLSSSSSTGITVNLFPATGGVGRRAAGSTGGTTVVDSFTNLEISVSQTIYYVFYSTAGPATLSLWFTAYSF